MSCHRALMSSWEPRVGRVGKEAFKVLKSGRQVCSLEVITGSPCGELALSEVLG